MIHNHKKAHIWLSSAICLYVNDIKMLEFISYLDTCQHGDHKFVKTSQYEYTVLFRWPGEANKPTPSTGPSFGMWGVLCGYICHEVELQIMYLEESM